MYYKNHLFKNKKSTLSFSDLYPSTSFFFIFTFTLQFLIFRSQSLCFKTKTNLQKNIFLYLFTVSHYGCKANVLKTHKSPAIHPEKDVFHSSITDKRKQHYYSIIFISSIHTADHGYPPILWVSLNFWFSFLFYLPSDYNFLTKVF